MRRLELAERPDWRATAEREGFAFHTFEGERYWDERGCYVFSEAQVLRDLQAPAQALHALCLDAVARIVESEALMTRLAIPPTFFDLIRQSWHAREPHLYGRFDFSYDGEGPAKLIEANYDTPTSLYEAAAFQLIWLEEQIQRGVLAPHTTQFNSIAEELVRAFGAFDRRDRFHFSAIAGSVEDRGTTDFLRRMAAHAGLRTGHIDLQDIGLDSQGRFVDLAGEPIVRLFKLHAWEHIFQEPFGLAIQASGTQFVEPAWKALVSNKGLLPLLWEWHPGHPNLLPAHRDEHPEAAVPKGWVRKPYFSREGANVDILTYDGQRVFEDGPYDDAPYILQRFAPLPRFGDSYTLVGAWVIGDQACGIGIREDDSLITKDSARFVPHIVLD
ncbi:glutathionylspermidine synthase family protein [Pseudomonas sp. S75]|uniref:glutathionylspermidine synthase family protein n=1 Tax=unclassified Pseudomonas TaxID=196821 RepID=UPI001907B6CF|nr:MULTISPECIES: glutathionylspermidine synthase family protein [unclassified Pseudomonas]MBJ9975222.1 glutathionylspermidine synthase family protein [Pseudomonas sp. S30]MBK0152804.1 glutathionylspermidine synthase family protein [Pseudomonas sp. S75]